MKDFIFHQTFAIRKNFFNASLKKHLTRRGNSKRFDNIMHAYKSVSQVFNQAVHI